MIGQTIGKNLREINKLEEKTENINHQEIWRLSLWTQIKQ